MTVDHDPIERAAAPSVEEFFVRWVRPCRPVVITGIADKWPAMTRWSLDYFADALGNGGVVALVTRDGRVDIPSPEGGRFDRVPLGDFASTLRSGGTTTRYVAAPLGNLPPRVREDFVDPPYVKGQPWIQSKFWLGQRGTVTPVHWDLPHNLSAQVLGRKRWLLYPASRWPRMYPCAPWSRSPNFSRVDVERPDPARFPLFSGARPVGAVLEPGEMLYIPRMWWHHVRSLDDAASLNFWFGGRMTAAAEKVVKAFKNVRGLYRGEWG